MGSIGEFNQTRRMGKIEEVKNIILKRCNRNGKVNKKKFVAIVSLNWGNTHRKILEYLKVLTDAELIKDDGEWLESL